MAALGPVATFSLVSPTADALMERLCNTGFRVVEGFDHPTVSDGQTLIRVVQGDAPGFSITYFSRRGVAAKPGRTGVTGIFDGVAMLTAELPKNNGEGNEVLGYVDSLGLHVDDIVAARKDMEDAGYFVLEEYGEPCFQSDVTDGLIRISLRTQPLERAALLYETDLDEELAGYLRELYGSDVHVVARDGAISVIRIALHPALDLMCVQAIDVFSIDE